MTRLFSSILALALVTFGAITPASAATITIINVNAPGVGFNDPTPAAPVGGNTGTTVGAQRLIAFQFAADVWGAALDSAVEIRVQGSFVPLACTATTATLGSAGAMQVVTDFPGAQFPGTLYHIALANKLAGEDLIPGDPGTPADDIRARFNSNIGQAGCLTASSWYYGLDTNHGASQINLATVLLHEFAHGLGFSSFANVATGTYLAGFTDVFSKYYFDDSLELFRDEMTDAQRKSSAINPRNVVWTGTHVTANVPATLEAGTPLLTVSAPPMAGTYQVGPASFGPALASPGLSGEIVEALDAADAAGPSTVDACSTLANPSAVFGRIALVSRGTCGFTVKVKNAQNAGAIAVIVADNVAGGPPAGMGGTEATITIPSVRITLADAGTLRAALASGTVTGTLGVNLAVRAGADPAGRILLYTPNPVIGGSSVSHWDTIATPNQLMEPNINSDLPLAIDMPHDLTRSLLRDVGWFPDRDLDGVADDGLDQCLASTLAPTVVIGGEDTHVRNTFFTNGCTIRDYVDKCDAGAVNHGGFVSCVSTLGDALRDQGLITPQEKGAIQRAAAHKK
jgi:hypothetical protein